MKTGYFAVLIALFVVFSGAGKAFSMAKAPSVPIIEVLDYTGVIKITKPYGGSVTVGQGDKIPSYIPMGSRIEVISGSADIIVGNDELTIESGELIYIWGDEFTGSIEFSVIPLEPDMITEPAEETPEEASPSAP